jgi:hypothetical protein
MKAGRPSDHRCTPDVARTVAVRGTSRSSAKADDRGLDECKPNSAGHHRDHGQRHAVEARDRHRGTDGQRAGDQRQPVAAAADEHDDQRASGDPADAPDGIQDPRAAAAHVELPQRQRHELHVARPLQHEHSGKQRVGARVATPPAHAAWATHENATTRARSTRSIRCPIAGAANTDGSSRAAETAATPPAPDLWNAYTDSATMNAHTAVETSSHAHSSVAKEGGSHLRPIRRQPNRCRATGSAHRPARLARTSSGVRISRRARGRYSVVDIAVVTAVAVLILILVALNPSDDAARSRSAVATVPAQTAFARGAVVQPGFLGFSLEYPAIEKYAGSDPRAVNPVLVRLIRNLDPGQHPVLRIGGDSGDFTWWPVAGMAQPAGVRFSLDQRWLEVTHAFTVALGAKLILGINFEADDHALAGTEAQALVNGLGQSAVQALELGNEPELYSTFTWYRTAGGHKVTGRPLSYDFKAFVSDFADIAADLPQLPLAGPATSGPGWTRRLGEFLSAQPRVRVATLHRYPLQLCFVGPGSPRYPSIAHLLSPAASTGLAEGLAPYASLAHSRGRTLRIDEFNSVSCGAAPKISQTFASALWAIDALFELVRHGVDGVNVHTFPGAGYELFAVRKVGGRWRAAVGPEYYGLLMFARAAPAGSRLVAVGDADRGAVKVWATRAPDGRVRVVAINKDAAAGHTVTVRVTGAPGPATVERLEAPSATARTGVTLDGQGFGAQTATGALPGRAHTEQLKPAGGAYSIELPAASAALLTLPAGAS